MLRSLLKTWSEFFKSIVTDGERLKPSYVTILPDLTDWKENPWEMACVVLFSCVHTRSYYNKRQNIIFFSGWTLPLCHPKREHKDCLRFPQAICSGACCCRIFATPWMIRINSGHSNEESTGVIRTKNQQSRWAIKKWSRRSQGDHSTNPKRILQFSYFFVCGRQRPLRELRNRNNQLNQGLFFPQRKHEQARWVHRVCSKREREWCRYIYEGPNGTLKTKRSVSSSPHIFNPIK